MRALLALAISLIFSYVLAGCTQAPTLPSSVPSSAPSSAPSPKPTLTVDRPSQLSSLVGTWDVALYFDPTRPPSATVLDISAVEEGALIGSFYGTEFEAARAVNFEGEIRISFLTSDGSGPYASAARLLPDGNLEGQTLSAGRDFLMAWSAKKQ